MEAPDQTNISLFQQIGNIQGTLTAQSTSNIAAFAAVTSVINEFKSEFRVRTTEQDKNIEKLRSEVNAEIKDLTLKVESLEKFQANFEGAKDEAKRNARSAGGVTGGVVGLVVTGLLSLITYLVHFYAK